MDDPIFADVNGQTIAMPKSALLNCTHHLNAVREHRIGGRLLFEDCAAAVAMVLAAMERDAWLRAARDKSEQAAKRLRRKTKTKKRVPKRKARSRR